MFFLRLLVKVGFPSRTRTSDPMINSPFTTSNSECQLVKLTYIYSILTLHVTYTMCY